MLLGAALILGCSGASEVFLVNATDRQIHEEFRVTDTQSRESRTFSRTIDPGEKVQIAEEVAPRLEVAIMREDKVRNSITVESGSSKRSIFVQITDVGLRVDKGKDFSEQTADVGRNFAVFVIAICAVGWLIHQRRRAPGQT